MGPFAAESHFTMPSFRPWSSCYRLSIPVASLETSIPVRSRLIPTDLKCMLPQRQTALPVAVNGLYRFVAGMLMLFCTRSQDPAPDFHEV
jgi:hypothetical protein